MKLSVESNIVTVEHSKEDNGQPVPDNKTWFFACDVECLTEVFSNNTYKVITLNQNEIILDTFSVKSSVPIESVIYTEVR